MAAPKSRVLREVELLARMHTGSAIDTLAAICQGYDPRTNEAVGFDVIPAGARVSAANSLLDRGWGKSPQTVVVEDQAQHMSDEDLERHVRDRISELAIGLGSVGSATGGDDPGAPPPEGPEQSSRVVH